jgi:hypothetical protein
VSAAWRGAVRWRCNRLDIGVEGGVMSPLHFEVPIPLAFASTREAMRARILKYSYSYSFSRP